VIGHRSGSFAEYLRGKEHHFVMKPTRLTFEQAAAVPVAGLTALQGLRDKGQVRPGQTVLVNGAGGGVGTFAVQIAKALGAHVTAVTGTRSVDMVRSIGADRVIDRTREDFTRGGQRYDVIFDVSADRSFADYRRALATGGTLVMAGAPHGGFAKILLRILRARLLSRSVQPQKLVSYIAQHSKEDLVVLTGLIEAGKLTPVIDRTYPLTETPAAIRHIAERRARGKVVITV
jgi:NADPH:quinone reductase-like Zn-dependent oxidoreductase